MYKVVKLKDFTAVQRSPQFFVEVTEGIDKKFSANYLKFIKGRDPIAQDKVCMINTGYSAVYVITEGELTFIFYENEETERVSLHKKEYVYITENTKYEITGNGELLTVCLPAYTEEMYSFPDKPEGFS